MFKFNLTGDIWRIFLFRWYELIEKWERKGKQKIMDQILEI